MEDKNTRYGLAVGLSLTAFAAFSVSDCLRKVLADHEYDVLDIVFWQALCGLGVVLVLMPFLGGVRGVSGGRDMKWYIIRGVFFAFNTVFSIYTVSRIPITDAYGLFFLSPFMISLMGLVFLKESIGLYRFLAICGGFIGALIAFRPGFEALSWAHLCGIVCVFTYSAASIVSRHIGKSDALLAFGFWPFLFLIIGIPIVKGGDIALIGDTNFWIMTAFAGVCYTLALVTIAHSFTLAPAAAIAPYQYGSILYAVLFDFLIWHKLPDGYKALGIAVIIASGVWLFAREAMIKRRQKRAALNLATK